MSSSKPRRSALASLSLLLMLLLLVVVAAPLIVGCGSSPKPSPSPTVERAIQRGQVLYDAQQYDAATEVLLQALVAAEAEDDLFGRAVCYISLSLCQLRLGNTESAAKMLGEAERIMPRLEAEQPGVKRGQLYIVFGRYHEAQAELAKAAGNWSNATEHLDQAEHYYRQARRS